MDRDGRENPPVRSGMTGGGGGFDLSPGVDPPTSGDPLSQSDGGAGDARRGSLFRPQALPVGPSGVRPPAGAPSVRSNSESLHPGAGILFGGSRPARVSRTERPSPTRVGWTVPTLPREPPGGISSCAPRGSEGVIGPELVDAITHVVRTEVARSLQGSPAVASVPVAEARTRRGGYSSPRRRLVYTSQSSDGEYTGGDSPYIRTPGTQEDFSWAPRRTHASIPRGQPSSAVADCAPIRGRLASSVRVVPSRITVNNPQYKDMFDCETYALENKSTIYTRKVFQSLRKFAKACDDSFVSEGEAFYVLQDFTREPLRSEVMAVMPTRRGGNPGEVTSYLELVNWMIRMHADEASIALRVEEFNRASQEDGEDELSLAERLRRLNTECGFLHESGALKGRFVEGVHRAVRATVRERNTPAMTLAELSRLAQTKGDEFRWLRAEQQKVRAEEARKTAEASRLRLQARQTLVPRTPPRTRAYYARYEGEGSSVAATTPTTSRSGDGPGPQPCWQCGQKGHWAETCPKLDARLKASLAKGNPWARLQTRRPTQAPRQ